MERHYWCFISYRHADNKVEGRQWASWLHQQLETYEVPVDLVGTKNERGEEIPSRIFPVFRDEEELAAGSLTEKIFTALDHSKILVVICSPRAVESSYVHEEIRYFKKIGKSGHVYAALIDGEPALSLPDAVRCKVDSNGNLLTDQAEEPLAANFRLADGSQGWTSPEAYYQELKKHPSLTKSQIEATVAAYTRVLEHAKLQLIAGVLGVPLDLLRKRDKAYQLDRARKRARTLRRVAAGLALLATAAIVAGAIAWQQRGIALFNKNLAENNELVANEQRKRAELNEETAKTREKQAQHALSMSDYFRANTLVTEQRRPEALAYLARAIRADPANLSAGQRALVMLQQGIWYLPEELPSMAGFEPVEAAFFNGGELRILAIKENTDVNQRPTIQVGIFQENGTPLFPPVSVTRKTVTFGELAKFSDDGDTICADSADGMQYFDAETGRSRGGTKDSKDIQAQMLQIAQRAGVLTIGNRGNLETPAFMELSPSGRLLAAVVDGPELVLCSTSVTGKTLRQKIGDEDIRGICFSPDERTVIIQHDNTWELSAGIGSAELISIELDGKNGLPVTSSRTAEVSSKTSDIEWFPDGLHFVRNKTSICNILGTTLSGLSPEGDTGTMSDVAISPDGRRIVSQGIWRRIGVAPFPTSRKDTLTSVAMKELYLSQTETQIPLFEEQFGRFQYRCASPSKAVDLIGSEDYNEFQLSQGGSMILGFCREDRDGASVRCGVWDSLSGKQLHDYLVPDFSAFLGCTSEVAAAFKRPNALVMWSVRDGKVIAPELATGLEDRYSLPQGGIHPDGNRLFVNHEGHLEVWSIRDAKLVGKAELDAQHNATVGMKFSPSGTFFITQLQYAESDPSYERIWDAQTFQPLSDQIRDRDLLGDNWDRASVGTTSVIADGRAFFRATQEFGELSDSKAGALASLYLQVNIPDSGLVPSWFADLLEAVGGDRLSNEAISKVAGAERRQIVASIRAKLEVLPSDDVWAATVRWWLDDSSDRLIACDSTVTVAELVEKRLASDSIISLTATGVAVPEDPRIFERLSVLHRRRAEPNVVASDFYARRAQRLRGIRPMADTGLGANPEPAVKVAPVTGVISRLDSLRQVEELFSRGERLRKGEGIPQNLSEALECYRRAAEFGHAGAQHRLGVLYATGSGVPKSDEMAVAWYKLAAEQGFAEAQFDLGVRFILGRGVKKDEEVGLGWYKRAAQQGYAEALAQLRKRGLTP